MTDQTPQLTSEEFRTKRVTAAFRRLLKFVLTPPPNLDARSHQALMVSIELTDAERAALLELLIDTFPPDQAESLCRQCFEQAGMPVMERFSEPVSDARFWAAMANANEIRAYAMACVERMSPQMVTAFRKWLAGRK